MPPTLVHVAFGVLLGAALLEDAYSRRALATVGLAAALPDLDAPLSVLVPGAHGAVFHTLLVPLALAVLLIFDARSATPWLGAQFGRTTYRVGAVSLLAWALAGTGPDLFNLAAANPIWPLDTMYYSLTGKLEFTTTKGVVQTFYNYSPSGTYTHYVGQRGAVPAFCNTNAWNPTCTTPVTTDVERILPVFQGGWQVVVVGAGMLVTVIRDHVASRQPSTQVEEGY